MSGDLISRSAVIKVLEECNLDRQLFEKDVFDKVEVISQIEAVPVVRGEWIRNENPIEISCECSICHAKDYWYDIDKANEYYWFHRNFCPNCGAKMKGGAE